ncbi:sugar phosphate isomerase/epimerase family protein [Prosthecobacter sp.]|uniref:sugar phosphate isomerase/epimerase family protein n=1 Tax=Prosthecobacter sp. TaxID=1965333 RepID=UPI002487E4AF|nr:sugar phosphate isomerase/epimerase family protein [Prosthecobacter sp.]MDI1310941.1 sugar phosphate isomerase/epimerase [Prosthecobacter sp.]
MTSSTSSRRHFLQLVTAAVAAAGSRSAMAADKKEPFKISLAEWSLNKGIFGKGGAERHEHLDFCKIARSLDIGGVEYVNQMFFDKATDAAYLGEMKKRQEGEGVEGLLIMCDREGNLGDPDEAKRAKTVENHLKWLDAAKTLGCHSIRVNAASDHKLSPEEQMKLAADGLHRLCVEGDKRGLFVVVENHGGLSSNGLWLTGVMKAADHARVGILPDFGNFYTDRIKGELYNPYKGLREFMPWVKKGMSAKAYDWDTGAGKFYTEDRREGREITLDFERLINIVVKAGYNGYIGIEYEGDKHTEIEGIKRTKQALDEIKAML